VGFFHQDDTKFEDFWEVLMISQEIWNCQRATVVCEVGVMYFKYALKSVLV